MKIRGFALMAAIAMLLAPSSVGATSHGSSEQLDVWQEVTFTAPAPCAMVCPYWLDDANHDIDGDDREDVRFSTCGDSDGTDGSLEPVPGPHQRGVSYDDIVVGPTPDGAIVLRFSGLPTVDWDLFICSMDGRELSGPCACIPDCQYPVVSFGCAEHVVITVVQGASYVLRAYNWSDPLPLDARYCFASVGPCEEAA